MPLPRSVEERGKRADEMIRQLSGVPAEAATEQDHAPGGMDTAPMYQDPAAGTEVQPDAAGDMHNWKDRFAGLQRTHAETKSQLEQARAALNREAQLRKQSDERIEALEAQMRQFNTQAREVDLSSLSEEDLVLLGEDQARAVARLANVTAERLMSERLAEEQRKREREVAEREAKANAQRDAEARKVDFVERLKATVKDFARIDNDPKFDAWIRDVDPTSKRPRIELLSGAYNTGDVGRAASFYHDFVAETRRDPRESQVTPAPAGAPNMDPGQGNKKVWTRAEVSAFYTAKPGLLKTDPSRAAAIEADIFAAQREGRLR